MFKRSNFCHVASNNRNNVKAGLFIYRTTDDLATVTASGYFNDMIIDINLHDLIIHEKVDATDNTKVQRNVLCVTEKTLENIGTVVIPSQWEEDIGETFVKVDGTSVMSGALKFSAGSMRGAIAGGFNGVTFFKMDSQGNLTQIGSLSDSQFVPASDNTLDIGTNLRKIERIFLGKVNNGYDIDVPVTNSADTLALKSQVDDAANSGEQLYATGVWYAKMYAATTPPAESEVEGRNYADFSQVDGNNDPIIVVYTYTSGAWTETATITPPKNHNGYMTITSKIWDISEQSGQQGGLVLWSHNQKTFTPYPRIISFENINVTGDSTVVMPANPSAQQIVNKDYVDNTVFGQTANTDLSNLTSVGQNIGNWSSNVTSCIKNIPQDIKIEFDSSTKVLTLKAGSKLYVPNGSDTFDEITIDSDKTLTNSFSGQYDNIFVFWDVTNNVLRQTPTVNSGASDQTTTSNRIWYDTTNNKIKYYENSGTTITSDQVSLPFCVMANAGSGNGFTKITQTFQGIGYLGCSTFVLPGFKALAPNGRNTDGTLNNTELNFTTVKVSTTQYANSSRLGFLDEDGLESYGVYNYFEQDTKPVFSGTYATWFDTTNNIVVSTSDNGTTWTQQLKVYLGTMYKAQNENITEFKIKNQVFRALDYNDSEYIAHCAMPSHTYDNLTLGASGATYTAPADGYFVLNKSVDNTAQMMTILNLSNQLESKIRSGTSGGNYAVFIPCQKGDIVQIDYTFGGSTNCFRFIYANSEA